MHCDSCGTENRPSARFCEGCGGALSRGCPSCGVALRPSARFCDACGCALAGANEAVTPGPSRSSAAVVAERRVCSILFVDLVGFTPFSEARDHEDVREVLSRYFEVARQTISRYGGTVEKFIGDAVMAVWGAPVAQEQDAERAVRAGLDLMDAVGVLGIEVGATGLAARAGVVTGEVAVNVGANGEGMVAGDAVNTASRVQSAARPGQILVDETTRRLADPAIAFSDEGTFELKGKATPERLFAATRVHSGLGGGYGQGVMEAPLVGRDAEFRTVKDLFNACVERRTPRLAVVTGPAGVGKSRLGWEFEKYTDGLAYTVLWHRGRCLSYGEGVAFWALAEIVRQRLGIAEEEPADVAAAKLREGLIRFVPDQSERDYVGVRLGRLLAVPYESEAKTVLGQDELFAGWRLFFEQLARVAPVVLTVEDAQHADTSLLGFFEHLIDWSRDKPIFVLVFARPGHVAIDAGYGVGRNRSTLSLDPIDAASMDSLVDGLVPGMPLAAREAITERAQGIPLFAVETIRSLIDQGVVREDGGAYRLVGDIGELRVPDSLHALLASRLDALPGPARALVADASVAGSGFPKEALVAVSAMDEAAVGGALAELVRRDVLDVVADPLSPERGQYRFSQEMLRQVAYETLSKRDRKVRHLAMAAHLRSTFANDGEEIADAIARHYLDALSAGPGESDADGIRAHASEFLVRAADRASRSGALSRAAGLYAQAATIAEPDRSPLLSEKAASASAEAGEHEVTLTHATAAREGYSKLGDSRGAARARSREGQALRRLGRHSEARTALVEALEVLRNEPDGDTVTALWQLADVEVSGGGHAEGRPLITEALDLAQALGLSAGELGTVFLRRGVGSGMAGRMAEAVADFGEAARLAEQAGDYGLLGLAQLNLADTLGRSDPQASADICRSAIAHTKRSGQREYLAYATANLVTALTELGDWVGAATVLDEALNVDHMDHLVLHLVRGVLAGLRGDSEVAEADRLAIAQFRQSDDIQSQMMGSLLDSVAALSSGDTVGALTHALEVLQKAEGVDIGSEDVRWSWPIAARAARALGDRSAVETVLAKLDAHPVGHRPPILRAERQLVAALLEADAASPPTAAQVDAVAVAVDALRSVGNPYQLAHGLIDLAEVMTRVDGMGTDELLDEARSIAERLGCRPLLERAASVRSHRALTDSSS